MMKKKNKNTWLVKVTYNSDNPMKYCELNYPFTGTQKSLENKIHKHYKEPYEEYGKAEAVEVELLD